MSNFDMYWNSYLALKPYKGSPLRKNTILEQKLPLILMFPMSLSHQAGWTHYQPSILYQGRASDPCESKLHTPI